MGLVQPVKTSQQAEQHLGYHVYYWVKAWGVWEPGLSFQWSSGARCTVTFDGIWRGRGKRVLSLEEQVNYRVTAVCFKSRKHKKGAHLSGLCSVGKVSLRAIVLAPPRLRGALVHVLYMTILWVKQLPSWGVQSLPLAKGLSKLGLQNNENLWASTLPRSRLSPLHSGWVFAYLLRYLQAGTRYTCVSTCVPVSWFATPWVLPASRREC